MPEKRSLRDYVHLARKAIRLNLDAENDEGGERRRVAKIAEQLKVSRSVVYRWINSYEKNGIIYGYKRPTGRRMKLERSQIADLFKNVVDNFPDRIGYPHALWSRQMIRTFIKDRYGISTNISTVSRLLHYINMTKDRRPSSRLGFLLYASPTDTILNNLKKIYSKAKKNYAEVCIANERVVPSEYYSNPNFKKGRRPLRCAWNMYYAIDRKNSMRFMVTTGRLNAVVFCAFLCRLVKCYPNKVFLVVDNHKVHTCRLVKDVAAELKDKLIIWIVSNEAIKPLLNE